MVIGRLLDSLNWWSSS